MDIIFFYFCYLRWIRVYTFYYFYFTLNEKFSLILLNSYVTIILNYFPARLFNINKHYSAQIWVFYIYTILPNIRECNRQSNISIYIQISIRLHFTYSYLKICIKSQIGHIIIYLRRNPITGSAVEFLQNKIHVYSRPSHFVSLYKCRLAITVYLYLFLMNYI